MFKVIDVNFAQRGDILYYKDKTGDELINLSNDTPFPKRNIGANKKMVYKWLKR